MVRATAQEAQLFEVDDLGTRDVLAAVLVQLLRLRLQLRRGGGVRQFRFASRCNSGQPFSFQVTGATRSADLPSSFRS